MSKAHINHTATLIEYPSSDGLPMAETDFRRKPLMYAVEALAPLDRL